MFSSLQLPGCYFVLYSSSQNTIHQKVSIRFHRWQQLHFYEGLSFKDVNNIDNASLNIYEGKLYDPSPERRSNGSQNQEAQESRTKYLKGV